MMAKPIRALELHSVSNDSFFDNKIISTEAHVPTPWYGQYLTHADMPLAG